MQRNWFHCKALKRLIFCDFLEYVFEIICLMIYSFPLCSLIWWFVANRGWGWFDYVHVGLVSFWVLSLFNQVKVVKFDSLRGYLGISHSKDSGDFGIRNLFSIYFCQFYLICSCIALYSWNELTVSPTFHIFKLRWDLGLHRRFLNSIFIEWLRGKLCCYLLPQNKKQWAESERYNFYPKGLNPCSTKHFVCSRYRGVSTDADNFSFSIICIIFPAYIIFLSPETVIYVDSPQPGCFTESIPNINKMYKIK